MKSTFYCKDIQLLFLYTCYLFQVLKGILCYLLENRYFLEVDTLYLFLEVAIVTMFPPLKGNIARSKIVMLLLKVVKMRKYRTKYKSSGSKFVVQVA